MADMVGMAPGDTTTGSELSPMVVLPAGLRSQILRLVFDTTPGMEGHRDLVARRAGPWDREGFPRPIEAPRREVSRVNRRSMLKLVAGTAVGAEAAAYGYQMVTGEDIPAHGVMHSGATSTCPSLNFLGSEPSAFTRQMPIVLEPP